MENDINQKNSNRLLIAVALLSIILTSLVWWYFSKPAKPIQTKGSFDAVVVKPSETKPLPNVVYIHDGQKVIVDSSKVVALRNDYNLTKQELDSLKGINLMLDSLAQASNDTRYQDIYNNCKFVEFSHVFDNDTMKATVSGITRGAPERLKFKYDLKLPKPKETVFALWAGVEAGINTSLTKFNAKANLDFQFGKSTMITTGIDSDKIIYAGLKKSIFKIKR